MLHFLGRLSSKYVLITAGKCFLLQDIKINRTHFNRASHEFKFFHYTIEKDVLHRHGRCKACGSCPLGYHCDGNRKLYRLASAKEYSIHYTRHALALALNCLMLFR